MYKSRNKLYVNLLKVKNQHGYDYRIATLSKSYLTTTGITMQHLESIV